MGRGRLSLGFWIGALICGGIGLATLIGVVAPPYDVAAVTISNRLAPPSPAHWLGTDHLGRDMATLLMVGAQSSIAVAVVAIGIGAGVGVPLGLWGAACHGRVIDDVLMRGNDLIFAFPALVIAILITASFGPSALNAILAIGIFNIPVFARVARGAALPIWQAEFILAARVAGKGRARISLEHILPNIAPLLVVQATIQFALGILAEAGLSYVGLGVQPPQPSWGRMLAEAQTMIYSHPMLAILPGGAIMAFVMGLTLMGDGLRDLIDPRLGASRGRAR